MSEGERRLGHVPVTLLVVRDPVADVEHARTEPGVEASASDIGVPFAKENAHREVAPLVKLRHEGVEQSGPFLGWQGFGTRPRHERDEVFLARCLLYTSDAADE